MPLPPQLEVQCAVTNCASGTSGAIVTTTTAAVAAATPTSGVVVSGSESTPVNNGTLTMTKRIHRRT